MRHPYGYGPMERGMTNLCLSRLRPRSIWLYGYRVTGGKILARQQLPYSDTRIALAVRPVLAVGTQGITVQISALDFACHHFGRALCHWAIVFYFLNFTILCLQTCSVSAIWPRVQVTLNAIAEHRERFMVELSVLAIGVIVVGTILGATRTAPARRTPRQWFWSIRCGQKRYPQRITVLVEAPSANFNKNSSQTQSLL